MARIVEAEIGNVLPVPPGTAPNYNKENPLWGVLRAVEEGSAHSTVEVVADAARLVGRLNG